MNNDTKITLTVAQLRQLVKECAPSRAAHRGRLNEAKADGRDGIFHAQGLVKAGLELRRDIDVYDLDDKKARFYALPGTDVGVIYSRHGADTTLIPYDNDHPAKNRSQSISGNYDEIMEQFDAFIEKIKKLAKK